MKTLVKYIPGSVWLTVVCYGFQSRTLRAADLVSAGLGDNTVQADRKTVYASGDQMEILNRVLAGK